MCVTCNLYMLCRLLKAAGVAGVPSLTASTGAKEFIEDKESRWNQYTDCIKFSKRAQQSRRRFHFQVQTDGISVSVLMFQPFPEAPTQKNTSTATATPPPGRKRKRQQQISRAATVEWVKGLPDRHLVQPARIVGLDPGRKSLCSQQWFTANRQLTACRNSVHVSKNMKVCLGAAADGRRLLASSIGFIRQTCE